MGLNISGGIDRARHPERYPDRNIGPTFDPVEEFSDFSSSNARFRLFSDVWIS